MDVASSSALETTPDVRVSWLDDLATIIAAWRARRPVLHRVLIVLLAFVTWDPGTRSDPVIAVFSVLALTLPSFRRGRGRATRTLAILLVIAGMAVLVSTPDRLADAFPRTGAWLLLVFGTYLGARRGRWWPWILPVAAGAFSTWAGLDWWPDPFVVMLQLIAVLAARVAVVPIHVDARCARERLAVTLQRSPWCTSFVVCALAATSAGRSGNVSAPMLGSCLVALLFHATWRAGTLFDRAAPWTAALAMQIASVTVWYGFAQTQPDVSALFTSEWVLANAFGGQLLVPLALGLAFGRRVPLASVTLPAGLALISIVMLHALAGLVAWALFTASQNSLTPVEVGQFMQLLPVILSTLWLFVFHRVVTSSVSARRIVVAAAGCACLHIAVLRFGLGHGGANITIARGALAPFGGWIVAALVLLLARDVACVTRIPDNHPLRADWAPSD